MKLKVLIERDEDSGYVAHVPALPGCHTQGDTIDELMANVREAIEAWLETEQDKVDRATPAGQIELIEV
jgi:predicted RNase H-like HicB family nuclease